MKCINTDHPHYKSLKQSSGMSDFELFIAVSDWIENNPDKNRFPTLSEIGITQSNYQLMKNAIRSLGESQNVRMNNYYVNHNGVEYDYDGFTTDVMGLEFSDKSISFNPSVFFNNFPDLLNEVSDLISEYDITQEELNDVFRMFIESGNLGEIANPIAFAEYFKNLLGPPIDRNENYTGNVPQEFSNLESAIIDNRDSLKLPVDKTNAEKIGVTFFNDLNKNKQEKHDEEANEDYIKAIKENFIAAYQSTPNTDAGAESGGITVIVPLTIEIHNRFRSKEQSYEEFVNNWVNTKNSGFPLIVLNSYDNGLTWTRDVYKSSETYQNYYQERINKGWFVELTESEVSDIMKTNKKTEYKEGSLPKNYITQNRFLDKHKKYITDKLSKKEISEKPVNNIKPGVEELFDSNPELANEVYKALMFKSFNTKGISLDTKERDGWKWIKLNGKNIGEVKLVKNDRKNKEVGLSIKINEEYQNKGYGQIVHTLVADWAKDEFGDTLYSDFYNSKAEINTLLALTKKGFAEKIGDYGVEEDGRYNTEERAFRIKTSDEIQQITPQQKQQALQQYSQYLDSIFPDSKVKDVVYHGAIEQLLPKDGKFKGYVTYFSTDKNYAETFGFPVNRKVVSAVVNTQNPYNATSELFDAIEEAHNAGKFTNPRIIKSKNEGFDAVVGVDASQKQGKTIAVFEPDQIHMLGTPQDMQGFREFINNEKPGVEEPTVVPSKKETPQIGDLMRMYLQENPDISIDEVIERLTKDGITDLECKI